ncbi:hypothetical protein [Candidatus Protochlamydia phocaeensis]|uniref:hypothetical protein n=1 Tax=Candidatus Protochlamydia phocaeensis TaxID=1414722 RepID=UPI0008389EA6|nr:hypothetical protein [Candidatus Protochlamydia phocaeensis]
MIDGKLPPINPVIPNGPSEPIALTGNKASPSHLPDSLPFPSLSSTMTATELAEKTKTLEDRLVEELDAVLEQKEVRINDELSDLNQAVKDQKIIKGILDIEKWAYEYADMTKDAVKEGIGFLKTVLPKEVLEGSPKETLEEISQILTLSGAFLNALDTGASGVSLILKARILKKSRTVLSNLKTRYKQQTPTFDPEMAIKFKAWEAHLKQAEKQLPRKELKKLEKALKELDIQIKLEEKHLPAQQAKFGIKVTKNALSSIKIALRLLPLSEIAMIVKPITEGISCATTALSIALASFHLHRSIKNTFTHRNWVKNYQEWKQKHQPVVDKTQASEPPSSPLTPQASLSASDIEKMPWTSNKTYEEGFFRLIHKYRTIEEIRTKLKDFGIELDSSIESTTQLVEKLHTDSNFKRSLVTPFADFQRVLERFDYLIEHSQNLLVKRQTQTEKKIFLLRPHSKEIIPKIQALKKKQFDSLLAQFRKEAKQTDPVVSVQELQSQAAALGLPFNIEHFRDRSHLVNAFDNLLKMKSNELFETWMGAHPPDSLLRFYVDHQSTIEITTKNALKQMVDKKHEVEGKFLKFRSIESTALFTATLITGALSIALAIVGLVTTPVAGAGFILLGLSIGSAALSLGFFAASQYYNYRQKPAVTALALKGVNTSLIFANLRASIQDFFHTSKKRKLQETAHILQKLHQANKNKKSPEYQKALEKYEAAKMAFAISLSKVDMWNQKVRNLQKQIKQAEWQDFARQASLKVNEDSNAFDSLQAFNEALQQADFSLLSPETKTLLESQLGLDIEALQEAISKDPEAVKKALHKFFTLGDSAFISFLEYQKERIKAGMAAQD